MIRIALKAIGPATANACRPYVLSRCRYMVQSVDDALPIVDAGEWRHGIPVLPRFIDSNVHKLCGIAWAQLTAVYAAEQYFHYFVCVGDACRLHADTVRKILLFFFFFLFHFLTKICAAWKQVRRG